MAPLRYYASDAQPTTLAAALSSVTPGSLGTVEIEAVTDWPTQYPFTILVDWGTGSQEVAMITQAPTGTGPYIFANTVRGDDGSLSPAHAADTATVVHGVSARDFAQPQEHINGFLQGMAPVGITGATVATRYVGGVTGAAPTTGTFETGDWVADTDGTLWFCTAGGSPGTWSQVTASGTGGGGVQIGGDIGNTDAAPHVISTHLSSPLPLAQGGTGQDAASDTALLTALGALQVANNLSDLASATTARTNLGLGTAATQASSAFDAAGAAATAQSNAISSAESYANSTFVPLSEVGVASGIAPLDSSGLVAVSHIPQLADYAPTGLTGATAASRYVGATASGAPTSGTFAVGDFVIDQTGAVWICTTAGSPGTWTKPSGSTTTIDGVTVSGTPSTGQVLTATSATAADWQNPASGFANPMTTLGDLIYENSTPAPARLAGSTSATKQFLTQTGTGSVSAAPAWGTIAVGDVPTLNQSTTGTAAGFTGSLAGDVSGTQGATSVGKIQGVAVTSAEANLVSDLNNATTRSATATLLPGEETIFTGSTASQTLTLPASPPSSSINSITNTATVSVTLAPGAGATLSNFGTTGNITIPAGYMFEVVYIGTTWYVVSAGPSDFAKSNLLSIANGGTGSSTAAAALTALGALAKAGGTLTGWLAPAASALTFGTTIAVNAALGNAFNLTLTASTGTISNPTNPVDGQTIRFRITQGTGGSFTVAWGTAFDFGAGSAPTLSTAATKVDVVAFEYIASLSKWVYLGAALGN